MKYFLDTEFHEDGNTIDLISIGIVAEDGREYYAINADCDWYRIWTGSHCQWLRDNVMPYIDQDLGIPKARIRDEILRFVHPPGWHYDPRQAAKEEYPEFTDEYWYPIEFWGYFADYDWVALAQIFGRMIDLPKDFPMLCFDLKQELQRVRGMYGLKVELPTQHSDEHHALADARWNREAFKFLREFEKQVLDTCDRERSLAFVLGRTELSLQDEKAKQEFFNTRLGEPWSPPSEPTT